MIVKYIKDLSIDEKNIFIASEISKLLNSNYEYSLASINYNYEYFGAKYTDYSLVVFNLNKPLVAFYAFCKNDVFSFFDRPIKIHSVSNHDSFADIDEAFKLLIEKTKEIIKIHLFSKLIFFKNQFFVKSFFEKIAEIKQEHQSFVNLELPEEKIKSNIRKSYKSLINWGEKNIVTKTIDYTSPNRESFLEFKNFHLTVSKKKTRNDASWEIQYQAIINNQAFLILGYLKDKLVSGSYISYGNSTAYYSVGVYDRELMSQGVPVTHSIIVKAICFAKKIGLKKFIIGNIDSSNDDKIVNIVKFKRGFSNTIDCKLIYCIDFTNIN